MSLISQKLHISSPYIGTIDLETYKDPNGIDKVYACGYYTHVGGIVTYYIDEY
jgi:hypothetical protein